MKRLTRLWVEYGLLLLILVGGIGSAMVAPFVVRLLSSNSNTQPKFVS